MLNSQNEAFENQLQQQVEVNKMLEQMRTSKNTIDSALSQLNDEKSRSIMFQMDEVDKKEQDLSTKLRNIEYETKETDKKVLNLETEIQSVGVKIEIMKQEQDKDFEVHKESITEAELHHKRVEEETELKTQEAEFNLQRVNKEVQELQASYDDRINAIDLERKVILADRQHLAEMIQMEAENRERTFVELMMKKGDSHVDVNERYNQLKARTKMYEDERAKFEEEASKVHQYSLMVHQESELTANFKNNYDAMRKELENAREVIARERAVVKAEKLKHLELIGELETKQRSLELSRVEYIKQRADIGQQMWAIKRPLNYKIDIKAPSMGNTLAETQVSYLPFTICSTCLPHRHLHSQLPHYHNRKPDQKRLSKRRQRATSTSRHSC